jgi:DNA-binding CsgD family transcriptional regulator
LSHSAVDSRIACDCKSHLRRTKFLVSIEIHLVAEGCSNREIGQRLHISIATVKKHMENIHSKLYVNNRTQAVARARELALL